MLLTTMDAASTLLVHGPMLAPDPASHWIWSENAVDFALVGAAWVVADSLPARRDRYARGVRGFDILRHQSLASLNGTESPPS